MLVVAARDRVRHGIGQQPVLCQPSARRGVQLTDAGRRLVAHADAVIAQLEAAEAELASAGGAVTGRVRIASFQTAAHALVIPAFDPLEARYPELHCELVQSEAEKALPELRIGDVDMVLAEEYDHAPRTRDPALEHRELCRDALVFAVPVGHPAAAQETTGASRLGRAGHRSHLARMETIRSRPTTAWSCSATSN